MKRYDYSPAFGRMIEDGVGDYVLSWDVDAELASRDQRIASRDQRIATLVAMLAKMTAAFNELHVRHWDCDDMQPEEFTQSNRELALINSARALLKAKS